MKYCVKALEDNNSSLAEKGRVVERGEAAIRLDYCTEGSVDVPGSRAGCSHNARETKAKDSMSEKVKQVLENKKKYRKVTHYVRQEGAH